MKQFSIKNPMLSPRPSSTYSTYSSTSITTPRSSPQGGQQIQGQILIKTSHLSQLLNQFDKHLVSQNNLIDILKKSNLNQRIKETENQMTKQFANLNRIKDDNQRILKSRIKYLEEKLSKVPGYERQNVNGDLVDSNSLKLQIDRKNKEITELGLKMRNLENEILELISSKKIVEQEKLSLLEIIKKQEILLDSDKQQQKVVSTLKINQITQTEQFLGKKNLSIHNETANALFLGIPQEQSKIWLHEKIENLQKDLAIVQSSNSALRKELVQLHMLMDDQDQKYQKTIQKLQQKIQKLTQFSNIPRSSPILSSKSSLYSHNPRRRNSDLRTSTSHSIKEQQPIKTSNIIKLADFNIKFELQKNNLDETQDTKFTLTSSRHD